MHLYFIPRGIRQEMELFEAFMQTQMFPWPRTDLNTGVEFVTMTQGGYRDCGFCKEFIFPKECLKEVLDMLGIQPDKIDYGLSKLKKFVLRKMLGHGVEEIPKEFITPKWQTGIFQFQNNGTKVMTMPYRYIKHDGITLHIIGIKEDRMGLFDDAHSREKYPGGIYQEMI